MCMGGLCGQTLSHFTPYHYYFIFTMSILFFFFLFYNTRKSHTLRRRKNLFWVQWSPHQAPFRTQWLQLPSRAQQNQPKAIGVLLSTFQTLNGCSSAHGNLAFNGSPQIQEKTPIASNSKSQAIGPLGPRRGVKLQSKRKMQSLSHAPWEWAGLLTFHIAPRERGRESSTAMRGFPSAFSFTDPQ